MDSLAYPEQVVASSTPSQWAVPTMADELSSFSLNSLCEALPTEMTVQPGNLQALHNLEQRLTQIMLSSETAHVMLQRLTNVVNDVFQADCSSIALKVFSPESLPVECWLFQEFRSSSQQLDVSDVLRHPACSGWITDATPLAIADLQANALSPQTEMGCDQSMLPPALQFRAVLVVKTLFQGKVNGAIIVTRSHPHQWTESEVQLVQNLSNQVAVAISQAQFEQRVQQQVQYQTLIDQLTTAIRGASEPQQIFELAVEGAVSALQASRGLVLMMKYADPLRKMRGERVPSARATIAHEYPNACNLLTPVDLHRFRQDSDDDESGTWRHQAFWLSECRICQRLFTHEPDAIAIPALDASDISAPILSSDVAPVLQMEAFPALVLLPLENQGTILGCLVIQQAQQRYWHPEEVAFLKLVAAQISTAIIQRQSLRQVQALVEERTAQLQRSLDVQAKLYEKTRQQVEQLRKMNAIHEEFLSTMSHELLTPLTSMTLAIRMLRQASLSPDRQAKYLDILEQQCLQETNLINDLLALQKLETKTASIQLQKLDIKFFLRDLIQSKQDDFASRDLTLTVDLPERPLMLFTDPESLHRILIELLTNAKKYAAPDTTVHVKVAHYNQSGHSKVVLMLSNMGAGIAPDEAPYIFDKFRRGSGVTQRAVQGTGLGLALVKSLTDHLNGAIAVSSQPLDGNLWETCFTLTLPQYSEGYLSTSA